MKKLLHIILIIAIANLCFWGICCSNFSKLELPAKNVIPKEKSELSFISNNLRHTSITGEVINVNFNITPHSFRVPNFFSSDTNNQLIAFYDSFFCLNYPYLVICITNKLKTTDIIFPFHYFW